MDRKIFRRLLTLEEGEAAINRAYPQHPPRVEHVRVSDAYGRVLAEDLTSSIDVPGFDRSMMDGYAVDARDVIDAREDAPATLQVMGRIEAGEVGEVEVSRGMTVEVATGAPIPRGANAVVMIEYAQEEGGVLHVFRPVAVGENIMTKGSDLAVGETVLRRGQVIGSREMGLLSALGLPEVPVFRRPRVAILSTGGELVDPGKPLSPGKIYDVNAYSLTGAVRECGCIPLNLGIIGDDEERLRDAFRKALSKADVVLSSGSTSAGVGDIVYRVLDELGSPGVIIHGLAVKPGKPTVIALLDGKLVFALPGYPTSALTIFHLLVRQRLLKLAGRRGEAGVKVKARLALRIFPPKGRREFLPVHLIKTSEGAYSAYPILSGSGAITTFSVADGYVDISSRTEFLGEGEEVEVTLYDPMSRPVNLAIFGSQCPGLEAAVSLLRRAHPEINVKTVMVGSLEALASAANGGSDIAGVNIPYESGSYNLPYLERQDFSSKVILLRGYNRVQGFLLHRSIGTLKTGFKDIIIEGLRFINRNQGSGTRILIDRLIAEAGREMGLSFKEAKDKVRGYWVEVKTHLAVSSAIRDGGADVGICIELYSKHEDLNFIPICVERFDFAIPRERVGKPEIQEFFEVLQSKKFKETVEKELPGFTVPKDVGRPLN